MTRFHEHDLTGAHFERVSLRDAHMEAVDLTGVQIRGAVFNGGRMRGVELVDVEISGELQNVVVNGVDPASVGLACRPVGACRRQLMKQLDSTRGGPGTGSQTGVGRFYYTGFGLQNGLSVEIDDPVLMGAASTFVARGG